MTRAYTVQPALALIGRWLVCKKLVLFAALWLASTVTAQKPFDAHPSLGTCAEVHEGTITASEGGVLPIEPQAPQAPQAPLADTGTRYVYFAHGHAGSDVSWATAQDYTNFQSISVWPQIKRTFNQDYANASISGIEESSAIWMGALQTRGDCEDDTVNIQRNFVIAHSFGGLVSKRVYGLHALQGFGPQDLPYAGIITFDTPHAGAEFAANINQIAGFFRTGCDAIIDGPTIEGILQLPILPFFTPQVVNTVEQVTDQLCVSGAGLVNIALPSQVGPTAQINKEQY